MPFFDAFSLLECKKRNSKYHDKRKNGNIKRKRYIEKRINTSLEDFSVVLNNHGCHV